MKKQLLVCVIAVIGLVKPGNAQDERRDAPPPPNGGFDKSKLFIGGNFGLNFSSYYTLINVSPQLGYRFNDYFAAGAGVNFIYSRLKQYYNNIDYDKTTYGVVGLNIFGRFYPIPYAFAQLQPELNYTWQKTQFNYSGSPNIPEQKFTGLVPSLLAGAGGAIPTGGAGAFIIMVQYDVLQNARSPYGKRAFYSFGYNVGF